MKNLAEVDTNRVIPVKNKAAFVEAGAVNDKVNRNMPQKPKKNQHIF